MEESAPVTTTERFERIPLDRLLPSKTNPRHMGNAQLHELSVSIAEKGVVQPILVRPAPRSSSKFEIVAGERRVRASKLAQRADIPAIIRELTDEQVLELQLIENLQRSDLTPLEQARGFRRLIDTNPSKHSAETIATRVGMSPTWVWDRLKLLDLIPTAQELLSTERIGIGHAIVLARLKADDQEQIIRVDEHNPNRHGPLWTMDYGFKFAGADAAAARDDDRYYGYKPISIRELETWIAEHVRFDPAHVAKAQPFTFETLEQQRADAATVTGASAVVGITYDDRLAVKKNGADRVYGPAEWRPADSTQPKQRTCPSAVLGTVVLGQHAYGQTLPVCVARDTCTVHWAREVKEVNKTKALRAAGKTKQAKRREQSAAKQVTEIARRRLEQARRWELLRPRALDAVAANVKMRPLSDALVSEVLVSQIRGTQRAEFQRLLGGRVTVKNFGRAWELLQILDDAFTRDAFTKVARKYRVDLAKLERELDARPGAR